MCEVNRRKYFRINFDVMLCMEITITSINGRRVKLGTSNVCVSNIGIGGLSFSSTLNFPTGDKILYTFNTNMLQKNVAFIGNIVRTTQTEKEGTIYGVKFILDEKTETEHNKIFNTLLVKLKNIRKDEYYLACNKHNCPLQNKNK